MSNQANTIANVAVKCCISGCGSETDNLWASTGITFHKFPQNPAAMEHWAETIRKLNCQKLEINPSMYICSKHFRQKDFYGNGSRGRQYLMCGVAPTLFPFLDPRDSDVARKPEDYALFGLHSEVSMTQSIINISSSSNNNNNTIAEASTSTIDGASASASATSGSISPTFYNCPECTFRCYLCPECPMVETMAICNLLPH